MDVEINLPPDRPTLEPEDLVVPRWVADLRNELVAAKGSACLELANRISLLIKQADHPFLCAVLLMEHGLPDGEAHLEDFILDDVVLKQLLIRHAISDPRPILSGASRRFLFRLSEGQGDAFNIALHRHFTVSTEDLNFIPRSLFNSILLSHLPTANLTQAVLALELPKKTSKDTATESIILSASLHLLAEQPACSYDTHDHLLAMIEINSPADEELTKTLITKWRQAVRKNTPTMPKHRLLLLEIYGLLVKEHVFCFSTASERDIVLAIKALVRNEGILSAGQLAKATHSIYMMEIFKEFLSCPQQLNTYLDALENTEMLTASLEQDLGL